MFEVSAWLHRFAKQSVFRPCVPEGACVYAVGDIHGRRDLLVSLLLKIWTDAAGKAQRPTLVFLGDYVDRGPGSKDVVELVHSCIRADWEVVALRGNHDQLLLDFCRDPSVYRGWKAFGASETLRSYGVEPPAGDDPRDIARAHQAFLAALPEPHFKFLDGLAYAHSIGDYFFVHAGVRPGVPFERQSPQDLMWIRDEFLASDKVLDKVVVHGHTPGEAPVNMPNRICVDTGAYATNRLTAVVLSGDRREFLMADGGAQLG